MTRKALIPNVFLSCSGFKRLELFHFKVMNVLILILLYLSDLILTDSYKKANVNHYY